MKVTTFTVTTLLFVVTLTGCASKIKPETVTSSNGSSIEIMAVSAQADLNNNRIADNSLRVVTPTHNAVGKGLAVLSVLTGNIKPSSFDKENYKGEVIESMKNPTDTYLAQGAKKSISKWMDSQSSGYVYKEQLNIGHATWALIFKDATATTPVYQLKYKVLFYKKPEGGNMFSAYTVAECSPVPVEANLSEWERENYKKVTIETQKYMDACIMELNNQLPRLLKK